MSIKLSDLTINAKSTAVGDLLRGGYLCIYAGMRPTSADVPTDEPLLAELRFGNPAFEKAIGGVIRAYPLHEDLSARATGKAMWFRTLTKDKQIVFDGAIGTDGDGSDAEMFFPDTLFVVDSKVRVGPFAYAVPRKGIVV